MMTPDQIIDEVEKSGLRGRGVRVRGRRVHVRRRRADPFEHDDEVGFVHQTTDHSALLPYPDEGGHRSTAPLRPVHWDGLAMMPLEECGDGENPRCGHRTLPTPAVETYLDQRYLGDRG